MASYDELDDETLLKLIQRRQEESALQDRALNERSQLGGMIAGIAGGLEAGMRGQSGQAGAQRGMEFVDNIRRRSQALQQSQDTADITPLLKIAQMRAEKNKRREAQQDMMERLKAQSEFQIARDERLEPMKTAREMSRLAYMSGDKRMQLQAQKELEQARLGETGRRFDAELSRKQEFDAQKQAQFDAQMKAKQDEIDALTKRAMDVEGLRQKGATQRAGITAAAKAAPKAGKVAPKGTDEFKALPRDTQIKVDEMTKLSVKKEKGIGELDAAIAQLESPSVPDDQKVMIGSMLLKKLNDPEFSDAVGAEEVKRLGAYLEVFSLTRPGGYPIGRDLPRFTAQVKNKLDQIKSSKQALDAQVDVLMGRAPKRDGDSGNLRDIERRAGVSGDQDGLRDIERNAANDRKKRLIEEARKRGLVK